jgi:hypothetical protein
MDARLLLRPQTDTTKNDFMREVIGSKADAAAVGVVTETESLMAYIKQLVATQPEIVAGTTDTSPLGSMDLWSCSGPVLIHDIWGIVTTTAIQAQATNCKLSFDPDDGGSDVDLCTNLDLTGAAVGTILRVTRDVSEALIASLDVAEVTDYHAPAMIIGQAGDIKVTYGAASTGQINWFLMYTKIGTGVITAG